MIETMVAGLDEKLQAKSAAMRKAGCGSFVPIMVLGKTDAARDALARGVAALGADSEEAKQLAGVCRVARLDGDGVAE